MSLCWKIVRSEMYCSRIGVMCDIIGCTKNKACSKQFSLHQCTRHSSLLLKFLSSENPFSIAVVFLSSPVSDRRMDSDMACLSVFLSPSSITAHLHDMYLVRSACLSLPGSACLCLSLTAWLCLSLPVSHCLALPVSHCLALPGSACLSLLINMTCICI